MVRLTLISFILTITASAAPIERVALDASAPITIRVGNKTATSLLFPKPVASIIGYGLTTGEAVGTYHYAYDEKHHLLALRSLVRGKRCMMTVLMDDALFLFELVPSDRPMMAVTLTQNTMPVAREISKAAIIDQRVDYTPERLITLMRLAREEAVLSPSLPGVYADVESRTVEFNRDYGEITTTISKVTRFAHQDAFVFTGEIRNDGDTAYSIDSTKLRILVGQTVLPVTAMQIEDEIPPSESRSFACVVVGNEIGGRAHLSIDNAFTLLLPPDASAPDITQADTQPSKK